MFTRELTPGMGDTSPVPEDPVRDAILRYLARTGSSRRELSLRAGLNEKAVLDILRGRSMSPKGETLRKLSQAMHISVEDLIRGKLGDEVSPMKALPLEMPLPRLPGRRPGAEELAELVRIWEMLGGDSRKTLLFMARVLGQNAKVPAPQDGSRTRRRRNMA